MLFNYCEILIKRKKYSAFTYLKIRCHLISNTILGSNPGAKAQVRKKYNPPSSEKGIFQKPREVVCLQPQFLNVFEKSLTKYHTKIPICHSKSFSLTVKVEPSLPLTPLYLIYADYHIF